LYLCASNLEVLYPSLVSTSYSINDKLENVQRRFTKRINGLSCLSNEDRLVYLKLDSLRVRRIKQDMIMCYTITNGLVAMNFSDFFSFHNDLMFEHVDIIFNYTYQNADLTRVSLALLEEFASHEQFTI